MTEPELIKIGVLAKRTGVPIATIKHYLREGLIAPAKKTGRTMAYYDAALVGRVQQIKTLQREQYLPLDVIKETIEGVLVKQAGTRSKSRADLIAAGVSSRELDWLAAGKLAVPDEDGVYRGDDLELLATLGAARKAGITPHMLPFAILGDYLVALRALVDVELRMFRAGVLALAPRPQLPVLAAAATELSERLVVLLRRKLLLPTLRSISKEGVHEEPVATRRPARRVRSPHQPAAARRR